MARRADPSGSLNSLGARPCTAETISRAEAPRRGRTAPSRGDFRSTEQPVPGQVPLRQEGLQMLSNHVAVVDIGPRWILEPKRLKLARARFDCEVREPVPGFVALY